MGRPLRVGVQLPEVERPVRWPEVRDMAVAAERVGFDSLWVGDHLLYRSAEGPKGPWEAWSTLAAIGAVTKRIEIGPLVAATSFHNPAMLAKKAATIDEISDGRFVLGIGAGWNRTEYDAFGFPFDHRASRFEEVVPEQIQASTARIVAARDRVEQAWAEGPATLLHGDSHIGNMYFLRSEEHTSELQSH